MENAAKALSSGFPVYPEEAEAKGPEAEREADGSGEEGKEAAAPGFPRSSMMKNE